MITDDHVILVNVMNVPVLNAVEPYNRDAVTYIVNCPAAPPNIRQRNAVIKIVTAPPMIRPAVPTMAMSTRCGSCSAMNDAAVEEILLSSGSVEGGRRDDSRDADWLAVTPGMDALGA